MPEFNPKSDWIIWNRKIDQGQYDYVISIHKYEDGIPKIQLAKVFYSEYGHKFSKLGRITPETAKLVIPVIQEAIEFIENWDGEKEDVQVEMQKSGEDE